MAFCPRRSYDLLALLYEMSTRLRYLVSYDITNPRRLRRVARTLEGFGTRLQYSVFECSLDNLRLAELKSQLQPIVNHSEDQVLFVSLGPSSGNPTLVITTMGKPYVVRTRVTIV